MQSDVVGLAVDARPMFTNCSRDSALQVEREDGMTWSEDAGSRCVARKVHPEQIAGGWFGLARERHRIVNGAPDGLAAFQLVGADKSGDLPWEPGYDKAVRKWQPPLYEPPVLDQ